MVSICLTKGVTPIALRSARISSSVEPVSFATCASEKPDFLACSTVPAGSVFGVYSERIWPMSLIRLSFHRNQGSMAVSDWIRSTE